MYALGTVADLMNCQKNPDLLQKIEQLLQQFVFSELQSENPCLQARACQLYGKYSHIQFNQEHLTQALNNIYLCLNNEYLPVKVEAALALKELLTHPIAVDFLRPGLETLLHTYLKVMDEIDFDELIAALQGIVEVYEEEIAPFAVLICTKLSQAYIRLV